MSRLLPLVLLFALVGCAQPPEAIGVDQEATVEAGLAGQPGLYFFAGVVDGDRSVLWWTDPAAADPSAVRREVTTVEHAAGYPARGVVSEDGAHVAWLRQPEGTRHNDPAELVLDGVQVDEAALYLQQPWFVGDTLYYLRRWPGEPRRDARGGALQALDGFDLVALAPGGSARIVARWDALWVLVDGVTEAEPGLKVSVLDDSGPRRVELTPDGSERSAEPGVGSETPQVRGRVGSSLWEVSVAPVGDALLWRQHGVDGLDFVLERADGQRVFLVPRGHPAREVGLVGVVR